MNNWFVSDHHFGENRFHMLGRPFKTSDDMV